MGRVPIAPRRIVAAAVLIAAAVLVLPLSAAELLVAGGKLSEAASLPGGRALALRMPTALPDKPDAASAALARAALAETSLVQPAANHLAMAARQQARTGQAETLDMLAGQLGWRDERSQRLAFDVWMKRGRIDMAFDRLAALLRMGRTVPDVFALLDRGVRIPAFRDEMARRLASDTTWPVAYLAAHGAAMDDATLTAVMEPRIRAKGMLEPAIGGPLTAALLTQGRAEVARRLAARMPVQGGFAPGELGWSPDRTDAVQTPFDWRLEPGLSIDGNGALLALNGVPGQTAQRLLGLPMGQYWLVAKDAGASSWRWGFACGLEPAAAVQPLAARNVLSVPADCPVQRLIIAPDALAPRSGLQLPPLAIRADSPR